MPGRRRGPTSPAVGPDRGPAGPAGRDATGGRERRPPAAVPYICHSNCHLLSSAHGCHRAGPTGPPGRMTEVPVAALATPSLGGRSR